MESTTCQVVDWIEAAGGDYMLSIGENFGLSTELSCELGNDVSNLELKANGKTSSLEDVNVVWYRRDGSSMPRSVDSIKDKELRSSIKKFRMSELKETKWTLYRLFKDKKFLTQPFNRETNKMEALSMAIDSGLNVPGSLVTDSRDQLAAFVLKNGTLITKAILNGDFFQKNKESYAVYTEAIGETEINALPDRFFPALFQQKVEKEYEIRTFFLDNKCYSMAIFSQEDEQTAVDFRRYNNVDPNRTVPYQLPKGVERDLRKLMKKMRLKTGSIDLLKSTDGEYYFLEVNAVGQFGMVSHPCNYYLEKEVADYLIKNDYPDGESKTKV